ncbi:endonuclease/exonuclease/phosphatase family protein [Dyadobacter tibetensis]|uniref:endonuclease/exonuclease/phosphatase family protein n=1 Tax=Dyadobacter tibetensis TaxID=1211851 RepID=UPI0004702CF9|nr:endonuclease/exonuclease/phosphatase family protein [Dyadobacter tibetensis]
MKNLIQAFCLCLIGASCAQKTIQIPSKQQAQAIGTGSAIIKPLDYSYPGDSTFKILSWNVEHFVDGFDDPYIDNERENNPPQNMPERVGLLMQSLRKANADVLVFQEFESAKFLQKLAKDSLSEMGYRYFADIPSPNWYMNVVVMSRFPMGIINGYGSATTALPGYLNEEGKPETQNQLNTRMWSIDIFPADNYSFLLTGVHLKAGRSARDIAMRKGQLALLTENFNKHLLLDPEKNMVLAGDLNATPDSEEISLVTSKTDLKNIFVDTISPEVLSHPANSPSRRLDYILVNRNMQAEILDGGAKVVTFFDADTMRLISDHLPVMARFTKKDLRSKKSL